MFYEENASGRIYIETDRERERGGRRKEEGGRRKEGGGRKKTMERIPHHLGCGGNNVII